jgi:hypothetical protein
MIFVGVAEVGQVGQIGPEEQTCPTAPPPTPYRGGGVVGRMELIACGRRGGAEGKATGEREWAASVSRTVGTSGR